MVHQLVAQLLGVAIHIAGEPLTDKHPNHIGREYERTVLGICPHNRLEEHILPGKGVKLLVVSEAPGNHGVGVTGNAFVMKNPVERLSATVLVFHDSIIFNRREILVDYEGDARLGCGETGDECQCDGGQYFLHRSVGI